MMRRPIVMYLGGFAQVGGIEAFARDFLLAIANEFPRRELVIWGARGNPLLRDIADSGAKISGTSWRWGCAWNLPDYALAPTGLRVVREAGAVIFKRPPPVAVRRWMKKAAESTGRPIPFVLITPYRPAEYWGDVPDPTEFEGFDVITVQSEEGIDDLRKAGYRGRVEHIPLLPPESSEPVDFPVSQDHGVLRLGFLGRIAAQKNLGYLLDVYRLLTRKQPAGRRFEMHLFGDGAETAALRHASADLTGITFHGAVPRGDVADAIDSCDLFLNTSMTEGQCIVALEVLSRGRPLVATPVGALPEVLRQNELGRLAPLGNPPAYAAVVEEVADAIHDGRMTPQSVVSAFRLRYDYEAIRRRYLDLLTELVADDA